MILASDQCISNGPGLIIATENREDMTEFQKKLVQLSVKGLQLMFDREKQLFIYRAKLTGERLINEGISRRYTMISLLGLNQFRIYSGLIPLNFNEMLSALTADVGEIDNLGDLGLLLWLSALASSHKSEQLFSGAELQDALVNYSDALQGRTMELSWFLAGLSHLALSGSHGIANLEYLASETFSHLMRNYGRKGVFGHMSKSSVAGKVRGRIGSFADQVYPIYALTKYSQAYGSRQALSTALECATAICRLQGTHGQWWWHYDAATGNVTSKYPVYAVHQYGMAPMALSSVSMASGLDFNASIFKGLMWITGANELGFDMRDPSRNAIWRSLYISKHEQYFEEFLSLINLQFERRKNLKIRYECRPYCLGWLLYALANKHTV